jgi:xanthine dehydrogenase YagT iron-sulfur-binding subunit
MQRRDNCLPTHVNLPDDPRVSLLDLLRERIGLTGTKLGCNQGACGACTVILDGERVLSCLTLAVQADGSAVTTIEGLSKQGDMHPLQRAFIEHDGLQCGYCTPGQICSAVAMLGEMRRGDPSYVTADLVAGQGQHHPRGNPRAHERQSVPLWRPSRHCRSDRRTAGWRRRMTPFDYRRAADQTEALSLAAAGHCRFLGGGTNLVDLMRQNIEAPAALVDVSRLPATIDVTSEGGLIIGAAVRNSAVAAHPGRARAVSDAVPRTAGRCVGTDPQHGHRRRQPDATNALQLFL